MFYGFCVVLVISASNIHSFIVETEIVESIDKKLGPISTKSQSPIEERTRDKRESGNEASITHLVETYPDQVPYPYDVEVFEVSAEAVKNTKNGKHDKGGKKASLKNSKKKNLKKKIFKTKRPKGKQKEEDAQSKEETDTKELPAGSKKIPSVSKANDDDDDVAKDYAEQDDMDDSVKEHDDANGSDYEDYSPSSIDEKLKSEEEETDKKDKSLNDKKTGKHLNIEGQKNFKEKRKKDLVRKDKDLDAKNEKKLKDAKAKKKHQKEERSKNQEKDGSKSKTDFAKKIIFDYTEQGPISETEEYEYDYDSQKDEENDIKESESSSAMKSSTKTTTSSATSEKSNTGSTSATIDDSGEYEDDDEDDEESGSTLEPDKNVSSSTNPANSTLNINSVVTTSMAATMLPDQSSTKTGESGKQSSSVFTPESNLGKYSPTMSPHKESSSTITNDPKNIFASLNPTTIPTPGNSSKFPLDVNQKPSISIVNPSTESISMMSPSPPIEMTSSTKSPSAPMKPEFTAAIGPISSETSTMVLTKTVTMATTQTPAKATPSNGGLKPTDVFPKTLDNPINEKLKYLSNQIAELSKLLISHHTWVIKDVSRMKNAECNLSQSNEKVSINQQQRTPLKGETNASKGLGTTNNIQTNDKKNSNDKISPRTKSITEELLENKLSKNNPLTDQSKDDVTLKEEVYLSKQIAELSSLVLSHHSSIVFELKNIGCGCGKAKEIGPNPERAIEINYQDGTYSDVGKIPWYRKGNKGKLRRRTNRSDGSNIFVPFFISNQLLGSSFHHQTGFRHSIASLKNGTATLEHRSTQIQNVPTKPENETLGRETLLKYFTFQNQTKLGSNQNDSIDDSLTDGGEPRILNKRSVKEESDKTKKTKSKKNKANTNDTISFGEDYVINAVEDIKDFDDLSSNASQDYSNVAPPDSETAKVKISAHITGPAGTSQVKQRLPPQPKMNRTRKKGISPPGDYGEAKKVKKKAKKMNEDYQAEDEESDDEGEDEVEEKPPALKDQFFRIRKDEYYKMVLKYLNFGRSLFKTMEMNETNKPEKPDD